MEPKCIITMKSLLIQGGPELFAAAQQKLSSTVANVRTWKAQILIEQMGSSSTAPTSACGFWPGRRRGSLPVDVYIASSGSCSSESESSGNVVINLMRNRKENEFSFSGSLKYQI